MMTPSPPETGRTDESVSAAVVRTVAAYSNRKPTELPRINKVVDTDALNNLFRSRANGMSRSEGKVIFPYAGFRVTVAADGSVSVNPEDPSHRE